MSTNGPRWASPNRGRFRKSQRAESAAAAVIGGRSLPRSGGISATSRAGGPTLDGDLQSMAIHGEHKRTETPKMSVKHEWFVKVRAGAARAGRTPGVILLFETLTGPEREWLFLPLAYFQSLTGCATDTARFHGRVRNVTCGSFTLEASELLAMVREAGPRTPTLIVSWIRPSSIPLWVGIPLTAARAYLVEGSDAS